MLRPSEGAGITCPAQTTLPLVDGVPESVRTLDVSSPASGKLGIVDDFITAGGPHGYITTYGAGCNAVSTNGRAPAASVSVIGRFDITGSLLACTITHTALDDRRADTFDQAVGLLNVQATVVGAGFSACAAALKVTQAGRTSSAPASPACGRSNPAVATTAPHSA